MNDDNVCLPGRVGEWGAEMKWTAILIGLCISVAPATAQDAEPSVERGRYLVTITGCNDCHTAGYGEAKGDIPESEWLKGSTVGFRGPWGTSYASNLRLQIPLWTEDRWVGYVRSSFHTLWPPMPWYDVQKMSEPDLRSITDSLRHSVLPAPKRLMWSTPAKTQGGHTSPFRVHAEFDQYRCH